MKEELRLINEEITVKDSDERHLQCSSCPFIVWMRGNGEDGPEPSCFGVGGEEFFMKDCEHLKGVTLREEGLFVRCDLPDDIVDM